MSEPFWLNEPNILLNKNYITNIYPSGVQDYNSKLNSITRAILLLTIIGYTLTRSFKILISAFITLIVIVIMYKNNISNNKKKEIHNAMKEGFQNEIMYQTIKQNITAPSKTNPMMNVLLPEIQDNPNRKRAAPSFSKPVEKDINKEVKKNVDPKLFQDLGDTIEFERSMHNFYTTANTQIPNDQKGFAEFCYGGMKSCKDNDENACHMKNYRFTTP